MFAQGADEMVSLEIRLFPPQSPNKIFANGSYDILSLNSIQSSTEQTQLSKLTRTFLLRQDLQFIDSLGSLDNRRAGSRSMPTWARAAAAAMPSERPKTGEVLQSLFESADRDFPSKTQAKPLTRPDGKTALTVLQSAGAI